MKVLLVSQAYPPYPVVGALRAKKIAEMFRDRGHVVTVVTERLDTEPEAVRLAEDRLTVQTVDAGLPYRLRLVSVRNRLRGREVALSSWDGPGSTPADEGDDRLPSGVRRGLRAVRRLAIELLRLPDDQQHFVAPAFRASRRLLPDGVDLVYTTAPAFSTHFVGLLLRRRGVRWVAEFRDPWTPERRPGDSGRTTHLLRLNRWMEHQCLVRADAVVAVTESVGRQLRAKLPAEQRGKVIVAMNGIDELQTRHTPADGPHPYSIVHTGSFYLDRDPRPFLTALAAWMRDNAFGPSDVQVDFAGRCRHFGSISIEQIVDELGLSGTVRFHDWLSAAAVQEMLSRADLLLLLARSQPAQVPNKLFEYLGVRVPMLAVVDRGGESERILSAVGGQFVIAPAEGEAVTTCMIRNALECAYRRRHEPTATDESALGTLLTRHQFSRLAGALGI